MRTINFDSKAFEISAENKILLTTRLVNAMLVEQE